jgi:hypothetical protein
MASIRDLALDRPASGNLPTRPGSPWRARLLPAHFDGFQFHVETGSWENGRRIVTHEFPKRDLPYSEDMGKRAVELSVRGYIVQYPRDDPSGEPLYQRDYTIARDRLQERLDLGREGTLQLPTMFPIRVVCSRYRLSEEKRLGGYCVFDMSFVELGTPPFKQVVSARNEMLAQSYALANRVADVLGREPVPGGAPAITRGGAGTLTGT